MSKMKFVQLVVLALFVGSSLAWATNGGEKVPWTRNPIRLRTVQIKNGASYACSGTVVGKNWILTAAHCVKAAPFKIYFSMFNFDDEGVTRQSSKAYVHPDFPGIRGADIALIYLQEGVPAGYIPARLTRTIPSVDSYLDAAGYGGDNYGTLYHVKVQVTEPAEDTDIRWSQTSDEGICKGDSGGPVFIPGSYELVAVIQRTPRDCDDHAVGGSVPHYYDWIVNTMQRQTR